MTTHTPGPWQLLRDDRGKWNVYRTDLGRFAAERYTRIARDMHYQDGQLIAAAPELAQALKALLAEVREMELRVGWAGNGARDAAVDALLKAGLV